MIEIFALLTAIAIVTGLICVIQWVWSKITKEKYIIEDLNNRFKIADLKVSNAISSFEETSKLWPEIEKEWINLNRICYIKSNTGRDLMSEFLNNKGWEI